jgi:Tol biopolymer transport system component
LLILLISIEKKEFDISKLSANQISVERKITLITNSNINSQYMFPKWSSNGNKIIFIENNNNEYSIAYINSDGTGKINRFLQKSKPINWIIKNTFSEIKQEPVWSPVSDNIVFVSNKTGNEDLYITNESGSYIKNLTNSKFKESAPAWSPDGTKIVYQKFIKNNFDLWIISADGIENNPVLETEYDETAPDWSNNGKYIAYTSNQSGKYEIWLYNLKKNTKKQITKTKFNCGSPDFSPDNKKILFIGENNGNYDIYITNIDGSDINRITDTPNINELTANFSPNGKEIVYSYTNQGSNLINIKLLMLQEKK